MRVVYKEQRPRGERADDMMPKEVAFSIVNEMIPCVLHLQLLSFGR